LIVYCFSSLELQLNFWSPVVRRLSLSLLVFYIFEFFSKITGPIVTKIGTTYP
jgi:hypothetical protein